MERGRKEDKGESDCLTNKQTKGTQGEKTFLRTLSSGFLSAAQLGPSQLPAPDGGAQRGEGLEWPQAKEPLPTHLCNVPGKGGGGQRIRRGGRKGTTDQEKKVGEVNPLRE